MVARRRDPSPGDKLRDGLSVLLQYGDVDIHNGTDGIHAEPIDFGPISVESQQAMLDLGWESESDFDWLFRLEI